MRFLTGSGRVCLDLVRTVRERNGSAREGLVTAADCVRWFRAVGLVGTGRLALSARHVTPDDVTRLQGLREAIFALVDQRVAHRRALDRRSLRLVNHYANAAPPVPRLRGDARTVIETAPDVLEAIFSAIARDAISLLSSSAMERVRECADPRCSSFFLDLSRPGTRRWCSEMPCANRNKVRQYRARATTRATSPRPGSDSAD